MCDTIKILLISYFIFIYVSKRCCHDLEENEHCLPMRYHGTCQKIKNCPVALETLSNPGNHELDGCGFNSQQQMVCCPVRSVGQPVSTQEYYVFSGNYSSFYKNRDTEENKCEVEDSPCQLLCHHGTCKKMKNCQVAIIAYKNTGTHGLDRCGFQGTNEIVCCPKLLKRHAANIKGRQIKRKCEIMCQKVYTDNNINPTVMGLYIRNGNNATQGQFPHAAALGFENEFHEIEWNCGASLISPKFLLTAAHCFVCIKCGDLKKARMGIVDIWTSYQDIDVKSNTSHPDYNPTSRHNDIGIVELVKNVLVTDIVFPACLYTKFNDPKRLQIIGWGQTEALDRYSKSRILQYAKVEAVPLEECNRTMVKPHSLKVIVQTQICATGQPADACSGDSGGALQTEMEDIDGYHIVGTISYGAICGGKVPGIYTRVATYLDWIEGIVWPD